MKFVLEIDLDHPSFAPTFHHNNPDDFNRLYLITMLGAAAGEVSKGGLSANIMGLDGVLLGAWKVDRS